MSVVFIHSSKRTPSRKHKRYRVTQPARLAFSRRGFLSGFESGADHMGKNPSAPLLLPSQVKASTISVHKLFRTWKTAAAWQSKKRGSAVAAHNIRRVRGVTIAGAHPRPHSGGAVRSLCPDIMPLVIAAIAAPFPTAVHADAMPVAARVFVVRIRIFGVVRVVLTIEPERGKGETVAIMVVMMVAAALPLIGVITRRAVAIGVRAELTVRMGRASHLGARAGSLHRQTCRRGLNAGSDRGAGPADLAGSHGGSRCLCARASACTRPVAATLFCQRGCCGQRPGEQCRCRNCRHSRKHAVTPY